MVSRCFVCFALFIDLVTDQVQPLSRSGGHRSGALVVGVDLGGRGCPGGEEREYGDGGSPVNVVAAVGEQPKAVGAQFV